MINGEEGFDSEEILEYVVIGNIWVYGLVIGDIEGVKDFVFREKFLKFLVDLCSEKPSGPDG